MRFADGQPEEVWLRFCDGRPVSAITTRFLADCCARLAARGKTALLLVWDNASWHISKAAKGWIREHSRQVKRAGKGVRILTCQLPVKALWLNPLELTSRSGKRSISVLSRSPRPTTQRAWAMMPVPARAHCLSAIALEVRSDPYTGTVTVRPSRSRNRQRSIHPGRYNSIHVCCSEYPPR